MIYFSVIIRIYFSNGKIVFDDERIDKKISVLFASRPLIQMIFFFLIVVTFALENFISLDFSIRVPLLFFYLLVDAVLIISKTQIIKTIDNIPTYHDLKLSQKLSFTGITNSFFLVLFTGYLFKNL